MARTHFLTPAEEVAAGQLLKSFRFPKEAGAARRAVSDYLSERLLARLRALGSFDELRAVRLGSWARGELCPGSDVDLLLTGPDAPIGAFTAAALGDGFKLRARVPENPNDWTAGVDAFGKLALFDTEHPPNLDARARDEVRRVVLRERAERRRRHDSVINYLEPNLKFGPGGSRDLTQALALIKLFPGRFQNVEAYPIQTLAAIRDELLVLRTHLNLLGAGDTLTAASQIDLARTLVQEPRELMRFVQSQLERASFYADWICARAGAARPAAAVKPRSARAVIDLLKENPKIDVQYEVRRRGRALFKTLPPRARGRLLRHALDHASDPTLVALHRTRVLEQFVPELKKIRGLVQHDHYHRLTADQHVAQALRETRRTEDAPKWLGPLAPLARGLNARDVFTLQMTALFHDLAKGGASDHAEKGARRAARRLAEWGVAETLRDDVVFLVRHHLALSSAAFRQNPAAPATWRALFDRGIEGPRLDLLTLFTAIDIRATNPAAWTPWKAHLLADLRTNLHSPHARDLREGLKLAPSLGTEWLALDPALIRALGLKVLAKDLERARRSGVDLKPLILRLRGVTWVRFHRKHDKQGLFYDFVARLFGLGFNVRACFAHTSHAVGVYDWFAVRGSRPVARTVEWLELPPAPRPSAARFAEVEVTARGPVEWVISCRGPDQRGLLAAAASALGDLGLSLRWARVHTWGNQVDDVFGVSVEHDIESLVARLKTRLTIGDSTLG